MRSGTSYKIAKLDNANLGDKIALRRRALGQLMAPPFVLDAYAGLGRLWAACYRDLDGVAIEKDEAKCFALARLRPTWPIYQADTASAIQQGAISRFPCTFLDFDSYGAPWPAIEAYFAILARKWTRAATETEPGSVERLDVVATDGGGLYVRFSGAWQLPRFQPYVQKYGATAMFDRYPEICQELMADIAAPAGYKLKQWLAVRCGRDKSMVIFWAGLERAQV